MGEARSLRGLRPGEQLRFLTCLPRKTGSWSVRISLLFCALALADLSEHLGLYWADGWSGASLEHGVAEDRVAQAPNRTLSSSSSSLGPTGFLDVTGIWII